MIFEIENLTFSYPDSDRYVLDNVTLTVGKGSIVSILGRNGSGKSTLLGCMLGLLKPKSGKLILSGNDISCMSERDIAKTVGYVPQIHVPTFSFSVLDFVIMGCTSRIGLFSKPGKREIEDSYIALTELGIEAIADKPYTHISGGERQKATIARAIVSKPQAVLFDEPTAHLDYGSQLLVLRIIKNLAEKGYSIVMTTHNPDHALLLGGKAALFTNTGTLVAGKVDHIITQDNLTRAYDTDIRLEYIDSLSRKACVYSNL